MAPNFTLGYVAKQTTLARLDGVAARGWLAHEAVAARSRRTRSARLPVVLGAALVRLGERLQGTARPNDAAPGPDPVPAR